MNIYDLGYDMNDFAQILGVDIESSINASLIVKTKEGKYLRIYLSTGAVIKLSPKRGSEAAEKVRVVRLANGDKS